ncbi:MAG TPA: TonB-dependent receptor [Ferrovibrio sp.]|uniref:TonB-dependent receptor family protein n=1 Tax=Ferrovibrio sp. TaxID=1917215 RepID=UPI002ED30939
MQNRHPPSPAAPALGAVLCLLAIPALAQTAADGGATALPALVIQAAPEGSPTVPSVADQKAALEETAGSVAFIDAETFSQRFAASMRDMLEEAPGIYVQNRYGQEVRLSVRGSGIGRSYHTRGVEILQDGIPTNLADGSGSFYQVDPQALRSIEVYKGGNGLAYGSTMLGGAINFVTPAAQTALAPNIVSLSGGSFGTAQASTQASRVIGDYDFLGTATLRHADGYRGHADGDYGQVNLNAGYRPTAGLETRFYLGSYNVDQKMPGTLTLDQALHQPRMASSNALSGNQARVEHVQRLANKTTWLADDGQLDIAVWAIHKSLFHPIFEVLDQDGWTYGLAPRWTGNYSIGGQRNDLILGARATAGTNNARQFVNTHGSRGSQTLSAEQDARNYEAYAENHYYVLPTVALMTGIKVFHSERDYGNFTAGREASADYDGINPKLGLLWEPRKDIQAFIDMTRSQDVPDFSDLAQSNTLGTTFVPLGAQQAWTVELGSRGKYDRYGWDITAYRSVIDGEMLQFTTNGSIPASTFNAGNTIHQGIELGGSVRILDDLAETGDSLTVTQLWTWSDFRFDGDAQYGDNRIAGVPQHVLRTLMRYRHPSGFFVQPSLDWVPQGAFVDYANTQKVPGYWLLGIGAGVELAEGMSLFAEGRNLTDKRYVSDFGPVTAAAAGTAVFYPGDGRSIYGGLRVQF